MGLSNFFSSLFGKAKQTAESASENISGADNAMDKATEVVADVKEKVGEVAETASAKLDISKSRVLKLKFLELLIELFFI